MPTAQRQKHILLDFRRKGEQVFVNPEDNDKFFMSVQVAAAACQMAGKVVAFGDQFRDLLEKLASWIKAHRKPIQQAFVTIRDSGFLFLVVQTTPYLDLDLEAELTTLDLEVAQDESFDLLRLNVLALPASSNQAYESFLETSQIWTFKNAE